MEPQRSAWGGRVLHIQARTVVIAVLLIALLGVAYAVTDFLGLPERRGPRQVSDRSDIVSAEIPAGWADTTERTARRVEFDGSGDPFVVPDISLDKTDPKNDDKLSAYISLYIQVAPYETLSPAELHRIAVLQSSDLVDAEPASRSTTIGGLPALTSSYDYGFGEQTIVTTVRSERYLVTVVQQISQFGDSTVDEGEQILDTLRIRD